MNDEEGVDFEPLAEDQCIVRVIQICSKEVAVILTPSGFKHLVTMPQATDEDTTVKPGNYVLIQATREGSRYPAEIIRVIDYELEKFYRARNLWPTQYDIKGCVEQLAEKIQIAQKAAELKKGQVKGKKKKEKKEKVGKKCEYVATTSYDDDGKIKKICKIVCKKSDKDYIDDSPIFPDDVDGQTDSTGKRTVYSNTDSQFLFITSSQSGRAIQKKKLKGYKKQKPAFSGTSGCCKTSCGGTSSTKGKDTGSGPRYTNITVGKDQLPRLFGKCTPWKMSQKQLKKHCADFDSCVLTNLEKTKKLNQ
ncbi:uncharacterized protein LOC113236286 [Hyposmocoma kahamanoa]|uniref:uncharacterized protein LOC113236286 n=1 Tax=Hyposmocoma kahamanoa TaxID=1477025 RepID=UPI000E6D674A|nr:uncharacterized protein LOC113236286 [Hyposmocoma kahamanoa]XP_026328080.1 uncharacterized protein LOC113236286 [Hyposmocoma kahamanoa]